MNLSEKLMNIQVELKAPKNLYNSFGKYKYRNAEGICEAVKPFLKKYNVVLTLQDDVICIGERIYIKATAKLSDCESSEYFTAEALARESAEKKGMDDSQITGTASSYARKYALNGLFLLDDTKDADTDEYKRQTDANKEEEAFNKAVEKDLSEEATEAQKKAIYAICKKHNINVDDLYALNGITQDTATKGEATNLIKSLKAKFGDD